MGIIYFYSSSGGIWNSLLLNRGLLWTYLLQKHQNYFISKYLGLDLFFISLKPFAQSSYSALENIDLKGGYLHRGFGRYIPFQFFGWRIQNINQLTFYKETWSFDTRGFEQPRNSKYHQLNFYKKTLKSDSRDFK
jgi:hypothetical protein